MPDFLFAGNHCPSYGKRCKIAPVLILLLGSTSEVVYKYMKDQVLNRITIKQILQIKLHFYHCRRNTVTTLPSEKYIHISSFFFFFWQNDSFQILKKHQRKKLFPFRTSWSYLLKYIYIIFYFFFTGREGHRF